jgi:hypothetical protein
MCICLFSLRKADFDRYARFEFLMEFVPLLQLLLDSQK